jgi:hypothetical protein
MGMANITKIGRIVSRNTSLGPVTPTFVSPVSRDAAIAMAKANAGSVATNVGRVFSGWPQLLPYTNDNSGFTLQAPQYVWDLFTTTPQTRYFAAAITSSAILTGAQLIFNLRVFCDNAHDALIEVYDATTGALVDIITPAPPVNLIDGSLDPNAGTADDVPFNWLNVRYYSNVSKPIPVDVTYDIVVSFRAENYNINPPGSNNPAGLAFALDVYTVD